MDPRVRTGLPGQIGPYQVLEVLGHGGMGVVYRAQHRQSGLLAAVKTVPVANQTVLDSLRREIRALARLRHPGIVRILDEGLHQGLPWYAMELLEGQPLHHYLLESHGPFQPASPPPPEADPGPRPPRLTRPVELTRLATPGMEVLPSPSPARRSKSRGQHTRPVVPASPASVSQGPLPATAVARRAVDSGRLEQVLRIMHQLCWTLSYLHGEGLVHRDLKPLNVLVQPDGTPVLIDFGLLATFGGQTGRDALDLEALGAGTAAYMAPEQIRGEPCDARADLYGLGCILFELLTGARPFEARSTTEVLAAQLFREPSAPSRLAAGLPPALDELVLHLLAKDPRRRIGHAGDVAAALERLGAPATRRPGPPVRAYLYRPGFAGHLTELELLRQRLRGLQDGAAGVALIGGQSGIGKTRLVLELAREAALQRIEVLTGEALPSGRHGADRALDPLRQPLQRLADRCRELGPAETARLLGQRGKLLAQYEASLRDLPGLEAYPEPAELPAEPARVRLWACLSETLRAFAAPSPLLLVLDDLQWADELTLGWLRYWLRSLQPGAPTAAGQPAASAPVLILGTYRSEEVGDALHQLLDAATTAGAVSLSLGPLPEASVAAMVGDMLALQPAPPLFSRFLATQSEGNPFFVAEYLKAAVEEHLLWRDEQGQWQVADPEDGRRKDQAATYATYEALGLPGSLRELVDRRLASLSPLARALVEAAAVLGRELPLRLLERAAPDAAGALDELLQRQVLEEAAVQPIPDSAAAARLPGQGVASSRPPSLRFVHDKLREGALSRIDEARRPLLHRAAAMAIEALDLAHDRLASLGQHWEQAGEPDKGRCCYLAAARRATQSHSHQEAELLYRAYLRLATEPEPENIVARNELGEKVLGLRGRSGEALAELGRAAQDAQRIGDRALEGESLRLSGWVYWTTGRPQQARPCFEQALDCLRKAGDRRNEGNVLNNLGSVHTELGQLEQARQLYEQAAAIFREVGDRRLEGGVMSNLGIVHMGQGRLEQARQLHEEALAVCRETGERRSEGNALANLGVLHAQLGRPEMAQQLYEQALAVFREVGDRRSEGNVMGNLGMVHRAQGRPEQALQFYELALGFLREVGARHGEGHVLTKLGNLHMEQGQMGQARQFYGQALDLLREVGDQRVQGGVLRGLARLELLETGDLAAASLLVQQAQDLFTAAGDYPTLGKLMCERGHIELAGGRSGRGFLERAQVLAETSEAGPDSELSKDVAALRRSIGAFETGQPLVCGCRPEDLAASHLQWLREHRAGALPDAVLVRLGPNGHLRPELQPGPDRGEEREQSQ